MISIALCDDEREILDLELRIIKSYMKRNGYQYVIDTFDSGTDIMKLGSKITKYDIIFLDVEMPGINGLEVAENIRNKYSLDITIVYVSAFISYATEPYKVKALRYVLKNKDSIEKAIYECMDAYISESEYSEYRYHKSLKYGEKSFPVGNIVYIESHLHELYFYVIENGSIKKYVAIGKLDDEEIMLKKYRFIRVHKSFLVNYNYIREVSRNGVELKNDQIISVAQSRYNNVRDEFILYTGEF